MRELADQFGPQDTALADQFSPQDRELYESHLRRLRYDDRDCVMYQNMLDFLWPYVTGKIVIEEQDLIYEEYTRWNMQMIRKVLYHDHDLPYANIRRCYQSILELIRHKPEDGLEQLKAIGRESFSYDGKAAKLRMDARGRVYRPMSKLFVIYNYAKYYQKHGMEEELAGLKESYPYAFTSFGDQEHAEHDRYLIEQMEILADKIIYPVEERCYKIPWGPKDFYLYYDEHSYIDL